MSTPDEQQQQLNTTEQEIIRRFDELAARGVVQFGNDSYTNTIEDGGIKFEFIVSSALTTKPHYGNASADQDRQKNPTSRPLGDINYLGFEIEEINGTHILAYNKFSAVKPQMMALTLDPTRKQTEDLDREDLAAAWKALTSLGERYIAFYNCGPIGGCSRLHKHMQVVPRPAGAGTLWPDQKPEARPDLPFRYFEEPLARDTTPDAILAAYGRMMNRVREEALTPEAEYVPHNALLARDWLVVVPRTHTAHGGVNANAACMVGIVWVGSMEEYRRWEAGGPMSIVEHCCVSKSSPGQPSEQGLA